MNFFFFPVLRPKIVYNGQNDNKACQKENNSKYISTIPNVPVITFAALQTGND